MSLHVNVRLLRIFRLRQFVSVLILYQLCCASLLLAQPRPYPERFTIEQVLGAPFPSDLVAAPGQARVAWVQNEKGVRNIWVAESPEFRGRKVTEYTLDDGQAIGDLQFTRDGENIVYVHGGSANRQGEYPNPTSNPESVAQEIWLVPVSGDSARKLAQGSNPAVSPVEHRVAFLRKGQVWSVSTDTSGTAEQMFKIRGRARSLRWSPDGAKLAFVSARGDHSFIGIYDLHAKMLRYPDASVDRDGNPVWSPDGTRLAYMRIPNERKRLPFQPRREALPWSIRVLDVATGAGRQIWAAGPGAGSAFRFVSADNQLLWGAGDRLIFPWEKDGWTHLYSVPANGGRATLLTPGVFEVQFVSLSPDRREVYFSSNQNDIDRQHLWRVAVTGGAPRQVTRGKGIEWSPVKLAGANALAFLASGATTPAHAEIIVGSAAPRPLVPDWLPQDFPEGELVEPEQIVFSAADGMRIHGQLFRPRNMKKGERRPGVLFFHGGSRRQMLLGFHHRGYYHNAYAMNQYLASRGYIVLSVNYRSGIGYGMAFREALNYGARGASEFNDVLGAGLYLRSRLDVDPDRIGLWGGSYGGYLTALGLARASDLFAAGVDLHGVHDWNVVIRNFVPAYDAAKRAEVARLAFESSPMASIKDWRSPVLLIHGDDDRNVPFSESVDLAESLRRQGVDFEQLIFPDEVHGFLLHKSWVAAYRAAFDFFERKLRLKAEQ